MQPAKHPYVIKISCPATSGIVAAVTSYLADHGCYISEMAQFDDEISGAFFMRAVFRFNSDFAGDIRQIHDGFVDVAEEVLLHALW